MSSPLKITSGYHAKKIPGAAPSPESFDEHSIAALDPTPACTGVGKISRQLHK